MKKTTKKPCESCGSIGTEKLNKKLPTCTCGNCGAKRNFTFIEKINGKSIAVQSIVVRKNKPILIQLL